MAIWKVHCEENRYPGMWQRWFRSQCAAVGWVAKRGYYLNSDSKGRTPKYSKAWARARKALKAIKEGDYVLVTLPKNRLARLGVVIGKAIEDREWSPTVSPKAHPPYGENGRRILVRWDLESGPLSPDMVVKLPESLRLSPGELRPTICRIRSLTLSDLKKIMKEDSNWIGLLSLFKYESALSGYIAAYPHHLEDGLELHPDKKIREHMFTDKSRFRCFADG